VAINGALPLDRLCVAIALRNQHLLWPRNTCDDSGPDDLPATELSWPKN